jgi:uncharacterized protein (TIGR02145 family)
MVAAKNQNTLIRMILVKSKSLIFLLILIVSACENRKATKDRTIEESVVNDTLPADLKGTFVKIKYQHWSAKNLNVSTFRNGEKIPEAKTKEEWIKLGNMGQAAWCYYENDSANGIKYGKLYNWFAVNDPRGLAPEGQHIPSEEEWTVMIDYLGGLDKAGKKLKSSDGWEREGNGTDEFLFSAQPAGERHVDGEFSAMGSLTNWWSSTEKESAYAWNRHIFYFNDFVNRNYVSKKGGFSVRCLKD